MHGEPGPIHLTRAQVREVDRLAIEKYHIPGIVLMENAARGVTDEAMKMIDPASAKVAIICGRGNNGGDGYAVARHLHNAGVDVFTIATNLDLSGDALTNFQIIQAMGIAAIHFDPEKASDLRTIDLIVDALFGTGLTRPPEGDMKSLIEWMNATGAPILAIDVPSGLDCDTGEPLGACVRAHRTVTFVAPKAGFANPVSHPYTGEVVVADIGCPRDLIEQVLH
jgi:NAD(P)H-hydrate epimerase